MNSYIFQKYFYLKNKIKLLEVHYRKNIFAFVDEEFNVYIYNCFSQSIIRGFNMKLLNPDDYEVKDISFFYYSHNSALLDANIESSRKNRNFSNNNFSIRDEILIITVEKQILFYNMISRQITHTINYDDIDKKYPLKIMAINESYFGILTSDGCLLFFNISTWLLVKSISKQQTNKPISGFTVIKTLLNEDLLILWNSVGTIFSFNISSKEGLIKLEGEKLEHDSQIISLDFNKDTEVICSMSKNYILFTYLRDIKISKKFKNFELLDGNKPIAITVNYDYNSKIHLFIRF